MFLVGFGGAAGASLGAGVVLSAALLSPASRLLLKRDRPSLLAVRSS